MVVLKVGRSGDRMGVLKVGRSGVQMVVLKVGRSEDRMVIQKVVLMGVTVGDLVGQPEVEVV